MILFYLDLTYILFDQTVIFQTPQSRSHRASGYSLDGSLEGLGRFEQLNNTRPTTTVDPHCSVPHFILCWRNRHLNCSKVGRRFQGMTQFEHKGAFIEQCKCAVKSRFSETRNSTVRRGFKVIYQEQLSNQKCWNCATWRTLIMK